EKGHFFGYLRFADLGRRAKLSLNDQGQHGSRAYLNHRYYVESDLPSGHEAVYDGASRFYDPPGEAPGPWRHLTVEVTPEGFAGTFDGMRLHYGPMYVRAWAERLPTLLNDPRIHPPEVRPRGGLGLYLNGCKASFRNCRIKRIISGE